MEEGLRRFFMLHALFIKLFKMHVNFYMHRSMTAAWILLKRIDTICKRSVFFLSNIQNFLHVFVNAS